VPADQGLSRLSSTFSPTSADRTRHASVDRTGRDGAVVHRIVRLLSATALVVAMLGAGSGSALAFGTAVPCTSRAEAPAFAGWGDTFSYFRVPNGGFESGATDWALTGGASVVTGNEPYRVGAATDTRSLRIPAGATAESRTICVSRGEDTIRLFVNNARVSGSILHVEAIVRSTSGQTAQTAFDVNGDAAPAGWAPTMRLGIPNLLGGTGTEELTLRFTTRGTAATWSVDDVYVDPYKSY
jgi:hypothetical protein